MRMLRNIMAFASFPCLQEIPRRCISSSSGILSRNSGPSHADRSVHEQASIPHQPTPVLLLEGDEFYVSHDGIARSFYRLHSGVISSRSPIGASLAVEELYDLGKSRKTFVVREEQRQPSARSTGRPEVLSKKAKGLAPLGQPIIAIDIQEIDQGVFGSAGTGATTWEASIAMALFFNAHPEQLVGDAVELGCGVGLGGILNTLGPVLAQENRHDQQSDHLRSVTLTDGNEEVLRQCRRNIRQAFASLPKANFLPISVSKLDWHEYLDDSVRKREASQYDTVIACDCAYRNCDVEALSCTMRALLRDQPSSRIHLFGPYIRKALHDLIRCLNDDSSLDVYLDWIELSRFGLKPGRKATISWKETTIEDCAFASEAVDKFLHITALPRAAKGKQRYESLSEID